MKEKRLFAPYLFLLPLIIMLFNCVLVSCKKDSGTATVGSNVTLLINNLSPDVGPVQLYLNNVKQNPVNTTTTAAGLETYTTYSYNQPSSYFSLQSSTGLPQLRAASSAGNILVTVSNVTLSSNHKYSLFLTGLSSDNSLKYIFTEDFTDSLPAVGRGKMRYINATLNANTGFDVYANGVLAFKNIMYYSATPEKSVSNYIELPAGTYDFKFVNTGLDPIIASNVLLDLPGVTVQDGHFYTMYSCGISGGIDTAAVAGGVITNQ